MIICPDIGRVVENLVITHSEAQCLLKFMDVFSIEKGFVVTKELENDELIDGKLIIFVPLWKWLLEREDFGLQKNMQY